MPSIGQHRLEPSEEDGIEASFEASNHRPMTLSTTMHFNADSPTNLEGREPFTSLPRSTAPGATSSSRSSKMRSAILIGIGICVLTAVGAGLALQERKKRTASVVAGASAGSSVAGLSAASSANSDLPRCSHLGITVPPTYQPSLSPSNAPVTALPTKVPTKTFVDPWEELPNLGTPFGQPSRAPQTLDDQVAAGLEQPGTSLGAAIPTQARSSSPPPNDGVWLDDTWLDDARTGNGFSGGELSGKGQILDEENETSVDLETSESTQMCLSDEGKLVTFDANGETIEVKALFLLCRQDTERPGYGLPEYDRNFPQGEPVYSELTQQDAVDEMSKIKALDVAAGITGTAAGALGSFTVTAPLGAAVAFASGALQLTSFFLSKSQEGKTDPTQELIKQEFQRTNSKISALSDMVSAGFQQIRTDLADIELDEMMESIQAMQYAFTEMQQVIQLPDPSIGLKRLYADRYRATCHVPHYKPEDIFRNLYGYACGNNGINRDCNAPNGGDTGTCAYGVKKRQFILDILKEDAAGMTERFEAAANWLLQAMVLTQFHYATCLPLDENTCLDPYTDPVRKAISDEQVKAIEEVLTNLNHTVTCFKEVIFRDTLQKHENYVKIEENSKCLEEKQDEQEQNLCIAEATKNFLLNSTTFNDKNWDVIVFNFGTTSVPDMEAIGEFKRGIRNKVDFGCAPSVNYGCVMVEDIEGLAHRFIFLMYRASNFTAKDYSFLYGDAVIVFGDTVTSLSATVVQPSKAIEDIRDDLFGNSDISFSDVPFNYCSWGNKGEILLLQKEDCDNLRTAMSREHGYWAWRSAHGIPYGLTASFATVKENIAIRNPEVEGRTMTVVL